jgi:hypothetical protein
VFRRWSNNNNCSLLPDVENLKAYRMFDLNGKSIFNFDQSYQKCCNILTSPQRFIFLLQNLNVLLTTTNISTFNLIFENMQDFKSCRSNLFIVTRELYLYKSDCLKCGQTKKLSGSTLIPMWTMISHGSSIGVISGHHCV